MATKANLVIDQGSTFSTDLTLQDEYGDPLALSGYVANSQIRKWYTSTTAVNFVLDIPNPTDGTIELSLAANVTANMEYGRYVYDIYIVKENLVLRVVEGILTVTPEVTQL